MIQYEVIGDFVKQKCSMYQYKASGFTGLFTGQFNIENDSAFTDFI